MTITFDYKIPRLGVGAGPKDGSRMCAMQVVSWENGDTTITDLPTCTDPVLAQVVQLANDVTCIHRNAPKLSWAHRNTSKLLCPECSVKVLDLAHRTVGTNLILHGWSHLEIRRMWVRLAIGEAESVQHLAEDPAQAAEVINVAKEWVETGEMKLIDNYFIITSSDIATSSALFAYDAAYAYHAYDLDDSTFDASYAYAAYDAAYDADPSVSCLVRAHAIIDRFEALTGIKAVPVTADVTARMPAAAGK